MTTAPRPLEAKCSHCNDTGKVRLAHPLKPVSKWLVVGCGWCDAVRRAASPLPGGKEKT